MALTHVAFWKQTPVLRLLLPFIAGILLQWYIGLSPKLMLAIMVGCLAFYMVISLMLRRAYFGFGWLRGSVINVSFVIAGAFVCFNSNLKHDEAWVGNYYKDSAALVVTIQEPLVEKARSYKALAKVEGVMQGNNLQRVKGKILLYFKKDSLAPPLVYGSKLVFFKPLQPIKNSGNPGSFNYQRYSAFHDIYHQCYLKNGEYRVLNSKGGTRLQQALFNIRTSVVQTLKQYVDGPLEQGVAEALLIGYRDDLDKDLVQAYSNTGVVHIIAISGLHLGMIYGTLVWLFKLFKKRRWVAWVKPIVILVVLWLFSLVAGGAPSIFRSAVMFSFLLAAEVMNRRQSIYNTLAASAFVMLCLDPFVLWDVGFQLSYAAVLSILLFMKPVANWFYIPNKPISKVWDVCAVTLSAQVLTVPIVCFYFHQFPNLFLITNLVVVPLSSIVLFALLCLVLIGNWLQPLAFLLGKLTSGLLMLMNGFIQRVNELPFAVYPGIQISVFQTALLYGSIIALAVWLMQKKKAALYTCLAISSLFVASRAINFYTSLNHDKLIVYNIPQHTAFDFVHGRHYQFAGDTMLLTDNFMQNFHLKPARILNRQYPASIGTLAAAGPFYIFNDKRVLLADRSLRFNCAQKTKVDVLLLSKNARVQLSNLTANFNVALVVFDGSNSMWKISQWKKECDKLHLRHYSTPDQGALILNM